MIRSLRLPAAGRLAHSPEGRNNPGSLLSRVLFGRRAVFQTALAADRNRPNGRSSRGPELPRVLRPVGSHTRPKGVMTPGACSPGFCSAVGPFFRPRLPRIATDRMGGLPGTGRPGLAEAVGNGRLGGEQPQDNRPQGV